MSKHTPTPIPISTRVPVLLVDDDDDLRDTVGLLLTEAGYEVAEADTIFDALRWLRGTPTGQVVLLDFVLTWHLNADLLLRAIERETTLARHRYVLMTGSDITRFSTETQRLITHCCTAVICKPFGMSQVFAAIAQTAELLRETDETAG